MNYPEVKISFTKKKLETLFSLKYGQGSQLGWSPRLRFRFGYYNPDDWYETLIDSLVTPETKWLDVGSGRCLFPSNDRLAKDLSGRCRLLVGVDPDSTILENPYVHQKVQESIYTFTSDQTFDLITLRMVAEHISDPEKTLSAFTRLLHPGSRVVIYTINRWSPVPLVTLLTPFWLHHPLKKILWGTEEKDTFPVQYKMNTKSALKSIFEDKGFREIYFQYLDDCRTFGGFKGLLFLELILWKGLKGIGMRYPENCLLGVYQLDGSPE